MYTQVAIYNNFLFYACNVSTWLQLLMYTQVAIYPTFYVLSLTMRTLGFSRGNNFGKR
jgi:hypothetical protein